MAFEIHFQQNLSETVALTKSVVPITTLNGTLRDESSIIAPKILVAADLVQLNGANYMWIPVLNRYYFIEDMVSVRQGLVEVSARVDVLSTYADYIRQNKGIVFRQEKRWNLYLIDGVLEIYQNPIVTTVNFPRGFEGQSYVLTLAGRNGDGSGGPGVVPGGGGSGDSAKTCQGLLQYAVAQIGKPYWFGTFGQIADQALLDNRRAAYPAYYTATDFTSQFGQRVHDCVGLIKGYRWSDTPTSTPVYNASQDVSAQGLYAQCSVYCGVIGDANWRDVFVNYPGVCVFIQSYNQTTGKNEITHVGVYDGNGNVVEARGHAYGVTRGPMNEDAWSFYGIPDWLIDNTGIPIN